MLIKLYVVYNLPNEDNMWSAVLKTDGMVIKILLHKYHVVPCMIKSCIVGGDGSSQLTFTKYLIDFPKLKLNSKIYRTYINLVPVTLLFFYSSVKFNQTLFYYLFTKPSFLSNLVNVMSNDVEKFNDAIFIIC